MSPRPGRPLSQAAMAVDPRGMGRFALMAGSSIAGRDAVGWVTHFVNAAGHFLGRARNYLVVFETDDGAYMRAVGNSDPMPWYVRLSYAYEGADAQRAFWGFESPRHSMLRQFARAAARRHRGRGESPALPPRLRAVKDVE